MSSLRTRQQRRKSERAPGMLGGVRVPFAERAARDDVDHGVRKQQEMNWRYVSGLIVLGLTGLLIVFFATDLFYVRTVAVGGANYLDEGEVFRYAGIAETHIFWVNPQQVREDIIASSEVIADARVVVGWPPHMVQIYIEEREPQVIWVQDGVTALIDLQGRVLRYPPDDELLPDLLQVVSINTLTGPPGADVPIPEQAVAAAIQLRQLGRQEAVRYHPTKGLGFNESSWEVWLGTGTDMPNRLRIYEALRDNLLDRGITPSEINVADPEGAYYCGSIDSCYE